MEPISMHVIKTEGELKDLGVDSRLINESPV